MSGRQLVGLGSGVVGVCLALGACAGQTERDGTGTGQTTGDTAEVETPDKPSATGDALDDSAASSSLPTGGSSDAPSSSATNASSAPSSADDALLIDDIPLTPIGTCDCTSESTGVTVLVSPTGSGDAGAAEPHTGHSLVGNGGARCAALLDGGALDDAAAGEAGAVAGDASRQLELNYPHPEGLWAEQCGPDLIYGTVTSSCLISLDVWACAGPSGQLPCLRVNGAAVIFSDEEGQEYTAQLGRGDATAGVSDIDEGTLAGNIAAELSGDAGDVQVAIEFLICGWLYPTRIPC